MIAQRDPTLPPAVATGAYPLPLEDQSVDAAMAILTVHHWERRSGARRQGAAARCGGPVVILTYDPQVSRGCG